MIFKTQIRRKSDPKTLHNVVVSLEQITSRFLPTTGSPIQSFQLQMNVHSDVLATGIPDDVGKPWPQSDVTAIFYADESQFATVLARLKGSGNLIQGIRAYCKNQVDAHNTAVLPGGTAAVHVNVDTDAP